MRADNQKSSSYVLNDLILFVFFSEPLHRMREFGASMKEMDIIDESTLSSEQMRVVCAYM